MKSKALWMVTGNGGYAVFQLLNMVLISKNLGVAELGVFSLGLALSAPIMLFSNFGTRILWITNVNNGMSFRLFRNARIISSLVGLTVFLIFITLYTQNPDYLPIMALIAMTKVIENNADIYYANFHKRAKQKLICISLLVRGSLGVIGMALGCVLFHSLLIATIMYFIMWCIAHFLIEYVFSKSAIDMGPSSNKLSKNQLTWLVKQGAPLAIGLFLVNLNMNIPRIVLEKQHGLEAIGIFSALYFFIQTGSVVINSIGQVILPILSSLYDKGQMKQHLAISLKTFGVVFSFSAIGVFFSYFLGDYFLNLLFNEEVAAYASLLWVFFLLSPAQYLISIMNPIIASTKKNMSLMWCQLVMLLLVAVLSFTLIPVYNITGAYWATAISSIIVFIIYISFYTKTLRLK